MRVDKVQFRQAARSFGGWIDLDTGRVIRRGLEGNPEALFSFENGEIIPVNADEVQGRRTIEIPRLCPGYVQLAFLKSQEQALSGLAQAYGLEEYMKESLPVFLDSETDATMIRTGREIQNRTLMLLEEHDSVFAMFEDDAIEEKILNNWCRENGIQLCDLDSGKLCHEMDFR